MTIPGKSPYHNASAENIAFLKKRQGGNGENREGGPDGPPSMNRYFFGVDAFFFGFSAPAFWTNSMMDIGALSPARYPDLTIRV
jgi:hypothetical protein